MDWIKIDDNTYLYEDCGVRFFLLIGRDYALLIDSGMQVGNAKELALSITDKEIKLFNTHTDPDHIGSNGEFDEIYMNPAELINYSKPYSSKSILPVYDGDIIDLGERELLAIALPGHTPGSTALLDKRSGMLFSGDPIQDGRIFMFGPMRDLSAYILSLKRLLKFKDEISQIYPCHGTYPLDISIIDKLIEGAQRVEKCEISAKQAEVFGNMINAYDIGVATLLCD